ncbi:MAG: DUF975 family protein [Oscillospiraceae bacterium]|nr:DUF975 family protein [Oscillospiraceae bacterium]
MWTRAELKARGKAAFKANYWKCVLVAFLLALFTGASGGASGRGGDSSQQAEQLTQQLNAVPDDEKLALVLTILGVFALVIVISLLVRMFLINPLRVGCLDFFIRNTENPPAELNSIGKGFRSYWHTFVTLFLTDLYILLWSLLLIVPGIIKAYSYRMVPYILAEHPEMPAAEIITRSREMMDGQKWNAFVLDLSFIGWFLLSILTLGIVHLFWTAPYKQSTDAALYLTLR